MRITKIKTKKYFIEPTPKTVRALKSMTILLENQKYLTITRSLQFLNSKKKLRTGFLTKRETIWRQYWR